MKKLTLFLMSVCLSFCLFSGELDIARQFVDGNGLLAGYSILDLDLNTNNTRTFLFYMPYNGRQLNSTSGTLSFTDGVIVKCNSNEIIQYLIINKNGLVQANDGAIFYDFSGSGYSHIRFNGWLLEVKKNYRYYNNTNCIELQLTNDGARPIPADPGLPIIVWDYQFNYPVKYEYTMWPLPAATYLINYEWREDLKIQCARIGLRDDSLKRYLDTLSSYDKRVIINAMFALHGYEFKTAEWRDYFSRFVWYRPDSRVQNSVDILDEHQRRLFDYLAN
ncbi:MAG: YARHG domain-containing protein [Treponema sp.]|jgi:hypothetical protein|nr:YARHG domain-containing protein [Treponema sp.]